MITISTLRALKMQYQYTPHSPESNAAARLRQCWADFVFIIQGRPIIAIRRMERRMDNSMLEYFQADIAVLGLGSYVNLREIEDNNVNIYAVCALCATCRCRGVRFPLKNQSRPCRYYTRRK